MNFSPTPLHIPDVYLSLPVAIACWAITAAILAIAVRQTNRSLGERQIPLMGVMAAFIFAAQMINFPTGVGVSGHLLGGVLAAILLGPWSAMLVMTAVIAVQGLLFQDGGLTAMGANILNMGLITAAIGYGLHRIVLGRGRGTVLVMAGFAAWISVMGGALFTSLELWLSGSGQLQPVLVAMLAVHAVIGLGEAAITVATLSFIMRTRPDLLNESASTSRGGRGWIVAGILVSLVVVLLAPFASTNPDGLNRVALDLGIAPAHTPSTAPALLPGYVIPALGQGGISRIVAGTIGLIVAALVIFLFARLLRKPKS
jgi:cobalt/nickel transport system permease protein